MDTYQTSNVNLASWLEEQFPGCPVVREKDKGIAWFYFEGSAAPKCAELERVWLRKEAVGNIRQFLFNRDRNLDFINEK